MWMQLSSPEEVKDHVSRRPIVWAGGEVQTLEVQETTCDIAHHAQGVQDAAIVVVYDRQRE